MVFAFVSQFRPARLEVDPLFDNLDAFLSEEFLFLRQSASEAGERASAADDAVAGDLRRVGILIQRAADRPGRLQMTTFVALAFF